VRSGSHNGPTNHTRPGVGCAGGPRSGSITRDHGQGLRGGQARDLHWTGPMPNARPRNDQSLAIGESRGDGNNRATRLVAGTPWYEWWN
jgi:hypothetical protein